MYRKAFRNPVQIAQQVDKICHSFLHPRGFSYFQFKRTYKDGSVITLANHPELFKDILENDFPESSFHIPIPTRQSSIYYWDESLTPQSLSLIRNRKGMYHGITIIGRRKNFYDCTTFAMSEPHPHPFANYFHILKDLQKFSELFPKLASGLIEKSKAQPTHVLTPQQSLKRKSFFLPKRSARFRIGEGEKDYVNTYEALCLHLFLDGKSYKEISSILSVTPNTVETHLTRLKARTNLTFQELSLQFFQPYHKTKNAFKLDLSRGTSNLASKNPRNKHID